MDTITGTPKELSLQLCNISQNKIYELKEYKPLRGTQANRYFHKLVNELARYNRNNGYAISDDEMKIKMNLAYGALAYDDLGHIQGAKVPHGTNMKKWYEYAKWYKEDEECDYYIFYKRTHELDSKEFYQLIKGAEQECRDVGIKTLDDIEFEKMMKEYEKELNENRI